MKRSFLKASSLLFKSRHPWGDSLAFPNESGTQGALTSQILSGIQIYRYI